MKRILTLIAAIACTAAITHAQLSPAEKATAAAEAWLKLVDEGAYPDAYAKSSEKWRARSREEDFSRLLRIHHRDRGDFKSRSVLSAETMKGDPTSGGQKINVIVVRFATEWSESKSTESVNVIEDEDGEWRAFGYAIQRSGGKGAPAQKDDPKKDQKKDAKKDQKKD